MFADRAKIYIRSGKGGDGHCSFRRELYVPNGGPDGGDGGRGGDLIFEVDEGLNTLSDYRHRRKYAAGDGEPGGKRRCHGKDGKDLVLYVPEGTVIKEAVSGKVIADMSEEELNSYRLTSLEEPSDEMLERIMADAAADARRRGEDADRRFFDELRERINKERQRLQMS